MRNSPPDCLHCRAGPGGRSTTQAIRCRSTFPSIHGKLWRDRLLNRHTAHCKWLKLSCALIGRKFDPISNAIDASFRSTPQMFVRPMALPLCAAGVRVRETLPRSLLNNTDVRTALQVFSPNRKYWNVLVIARWQFLRARQFPPNFCYLFSRASLSFQRTRVGL